MPWRVDAAKANVPDVDLHPVVELLARVLRLGERMDADRDAVVESEPAVTGDVVRVRVRFERPHDARVETICLGEDPLDREMRIDDDDLA